MKKLLIILFSTLLFFTACKKEEINPNNTKIETIEIDKISLWGEWLLLDGKMYVDNMETGQKIAYDHFDPNKSKSSLRYSGSKFEIEDIEQNITTWSFFPSKTNYGYGEFWLNNDSLMPYGLNIVGEHWSIIEHPTATLNTMQMGGSSRPISAVIDNYQEQIVKFYIQEAYENINGYNCNYYSVLRFKKIKSW